MNYRNAGSAARSIALGMLYGTLGCLGVTALLVGLHLVGCSAGWW